jgi:hypothetical protein
MLNIHQSKTNKNNLPPFANVRNERLGKLLSKSFFLVKSKSLIAEFGVLILPAQ